jgi:hypothetical protein
MDTPKFGLGDMVWHRTCGDDAGVLGVGETLGAGIAARTLTP